MTKKSEGKAKVKGADQEEKVLKKITEGNVKAAKVKKEEKSAPKKVEKAKKEDKIVAKSKENKPAKENKPEQAAVEGEVKKVKKVWDNTKNKGDGDVAGQKRTW